MKKGGKIRKSDLLCLVADVVIVFCIRLHIEDIFLTSMKGNLKCWGETRLKKDKSHVMVTLKGRFKGETGDKWNMLLLVDIMYSGIELRRWLYLIVESANKRVSTIMLNVTCTYPILWECFVQPILVQQENNFSQYIYFNIPLE